MRDGLLTQASSIALLFTQLVIAPKVLGIEAYGSAIYYLAPILALQAIYEAICQAEIFEHKNKNGDVGGLACVFILAIAPINLIQQSNTHSNSLDLSILVASCTYIILLMIQTLVTTKIFSSGEVRKIAKAQFAGSIVFTILIWELASWGSLALILGSSAASATIILLNAKALKWIELRPTIPSKVRLKIFFGHSLVRFPAVFLNSILIAIAGMWHPSQYVAIFKLATSAVNALRYASPYPIGTILNAISSKEIDHFSDRHTHKQQNRNLLKRSVIFWSLGSAATIIVFPHYLDMVFPGIATPFGCWVVLASGVAFQLLQPICFVVRNKGGAKTLVATGITCALLATAVCWFSPYWAYAVGTWIAIAFLFIRLRKIN